MHINGNVTVQSLALNAEFKGEDRQPGLTIGLQRAMTCDDAAPMFGTTSDQVRKSFFKGEQPIYDGIKNMKIKSKVKDVALDIAGHKISHVELKGITLKPETGQVLMMSFSIYVRVPPPGMIDALHKELQGDVITIDISDNQIDMFPQQKGVSQPAAKQGQAGKAKSTGKAPAQFPQQKGAKKTATKKTTKGEAPAAKAKSKVPASKTAGDGKNADLKQPPGNVTPIKKPDAAATATV